ncbi:MAG: LysM peptidoglycan-binding protein [Marmoricola sp.]|nr:LysM peptidoglycan-binding protein [Marmoricola sp.]
MTHARRAQGDTARGPEMHLAPHPAPCSDRDVAPARVPRTRRLARTGAATLAALAGAVGLGAVLAPTPATAAPGARTAGLASIHPTLASTGRWPGHPDRYLVRHRVRRGETATSLAVRYHAWTDELVRLNHLGRSRAVYVGQVLTIPVVVSAYRRATGHHPASGPPPRAHHHTHHRAHHRGSHGWRHADLSRPQVAGVVRRTARRHAVPSSLALAIAWQESGWQQRRISSTGAIGVMQVMPDTGRWMRQYAGRPLHLRDTHDNVLAGVLTLRVLRASTKHDRNAIGAYYQGLGAVRAHGLYRDTLAYVRSVRAIQSRIVRTGSAY